MRLRDQIREKLIGRFQIGLVRHTPDIARRMGIVRVILRQHSSLIADKLAIVRINKIIILRIVFVIGWRNKNRIEINDLNTDAL